MHSALQTCNKEQNEVKIDVTLLLDNKENNI